MTHAGWSKTRVSAFTLSCSLALGSFMIAGCARSDSAQAAVSEDPLANIPQHRHKRACAQAAPGLAACHAHVVINDVTGQIQPFVTPSGFGPADLASAYSLPATGGTGLTIAIVDAMDNPNAEADLG